VWSHGDVYPDFTVWDWQEIKTGEAGETSGARQGMSGLQALNANLSLGYRIAEGHEISAQLLIDRLLQHSFFITYNHFRSIQVYKLLQPVIPVDDSTVGVVEVRRGKTSAIQLDHGAKVRRQYR
jgi:hypothetical protein